MKRVVLACALLLVGPEIGCKDPGRLDLLLRPSAGLDLTTLDTVEVSLLNEVSGAELERATVTGAELDALTRLFAEAELEPDVAYVLEVRAAVDTGVCTSGRVVGRSVPTTIRNDSSHDSVTAFVACADSVTPTGRLRDERAGHAALWAPAQGGAVLVGGASTLAGGLDVTSLASVEIYDIATGQFAAAPALHDARFLPGITTGPDGHVLVMGGAGERLALDWLDSVEELDGDVRRDKHSLEGGWIEPRTVALADGTLAVLGVGVSGLQAYQAAFYNPGAETTPHDAIARTTPGSIVVPFPGRGRALIAGGDGGDHPVRPMLFCDAGQCGCTDGPCLVPIGDEANPASWGPGRRWADAAGAWLPCPGGGGAAYVVGGRVRPQEGSQDESVGDVYCYADTVDVETGLVPVGAVHARQSGGVLAVRGDRLLVVGGYDDAEGAVVPRGVAQAELIRVSPCGCEAIEDDDVTEVLVDASLDAAGHIMLGRSSVLLGDGTVLVTGTANLTVDDDLELSIEAGSDAWVFMPDLP